MSWSARGTIKTDNPYVSEHEQVQVGNGDTESKKAIEAAVKAVEEIIRSKNIGEGEFTVHMSGHANTGNVAIAGWSNDFLTITINKK